jgi:dTDP-glucose 4,6-dehydratase
MVEEKVMLTGVAGFMGSHTLEEILTTTNWHVVGIASWQHKGTPERIEEVLDGHPEWRERLTIITHDLNAPFTEQTKKRIGKIDYIINIASESHVDRSIEDPVPFVQNNVNLILNMLEYAREAKPKVFLQISTDEVYGPAPDGVDFKEWSTLLPSNPYSASKAAQEMLCISYWRTYGVPVIITNTMNLFGEMQDPEKYTAQLIRKVENFEIVQVHGEPGAVGSRYYLHARNQANALTFILLNCPPSMYSDEGGIDRPDKYHIVGDIELDNLELAIKVAEMVRKPLHYEFVDHHSTRPGHDRRYALDGSKLKGCGWKPPKDFETSLQKYVDWTLERPLWQ